MRLRWFVVGAVVAVGALAAVGAVLENLKLPSPIVPPEEEPAPF